MSKKIISIVLALVMVLAMSTVALVSVSADLADLPEKAEGTKRYYFYMPPQWQNEYAYTAGIYWWEGTDACSAWPGYEAYAADVEGVYYYDVPEDVTTIIWNNYLDGGTDMTLAIYQAAVQTKNIGSEYYDIGESDNYPDGTETFDGMIYVTDMNMTEINDYSGKMTYAGEWCYYYGNGEYGFTPVKGDGEVFSAPAFNWSEDIEIPTQAPETTPDETVPSETETTPVESETTPAESETTPAESTPVESETTETTPVVPSVSNSVTTNDGNTYVTTVGDVLTYTVDLTAARLFENIQALVTYDAEKLELTRYYSDDPDVEDWEVEGPIACPNLDGVIFNAGETGVVKFNASKVAGYNFKENKNLVTLEFKVIAEGDTAIDLTVEEMTIKGGDESYFAGGQTVITDGLTMVQAIAGNTVPTVTVPSETVTVPTETEAKPTETEAKPTETEAKPTETEAKPTETEAKPTQTEAKPTETEAKPTETKPAPTQGATSVEGTEDTKPESDPVGTGAAAYIYVVVAVLSMAALAVVVLRKKVNG